MSMTKNGHFVSSLLVPKGQNEHLSLHAEVQLKK